VIYDFTHAGYIDPSAALAIDEMIDRSLKNERHALLCGIPAPAMRALDGMGVLDRVPRSQRFDDRHAAIQAAADYCETD
jgi:MFS superfamily sulfate permease-like transporter